MNNTMKSAIMGLAATARAFRFVQGAAFIADCLFRFDLQDKPLHVAGEEADVPREQLFGGLGGHILLIAIARDCAIELAPTPYNFQGELPSRHRV